MNIGILIPGFSAHEDDWAIPVQQHLARELAAADHVRIIALRYPPSQQPYQVYNAHVYPVGAGSSARGSARFRLWASAFRLIWRLHRDTPFDVLHAMWADETGLIAGWAGRWLGVIGYGLQLSRFSHWIVGQALTHADTVIVASSYTRRLLHTAGYRVPDSRLVTGTLGVDPALFSPAAAPADPRRLINVASLVPVKDQAALLRATALVPEVTLDMVGTGSLRQPLTALAEQLGIAERVHWHGAVPHLQLPALYRQAGIAILTSRHEILAMSMLEAAACGLPVITTNVGTIPDHPEIGLTVPIGDPAALADAIRALLHDPPRLRALRETARAAAVRDFSIGGTAEHLRALYRQLTGS
jgi:glycosyltransferase involved in cell wall biosynthesis